MTPANIYAVDNFGTVVGENPSCYGILPLWAVNGLSIVCWVVGNGKLWEIIFNLPNHHRNRSKGTVFSYIPATCSASPSPCGSQVCVNTPSGDQLYTCQGKYSLARFLLKSNHESALKNTCFKINGTKRISVSNFSIGHHFWILYSPVILFIIPFLSFYTFSCTVQVKNLLTSLGVFRPLPMELCFTENAKHFSSICHWCTPLQEGT